MKGVWENEGRAEAEKKKRETPAWKSPCLPLSLFSPYPSPQQSGKENEQTPRWKCEKENQACRTAGKISPITHLPASAWKKKILPPLPGRKWAHLPACTACSACSERRRRGFVSLSLPCCLMRQSQREAGSGGEWGVGTFSIPEQCYACHTYYLGMCGSLMHAEWRRRWRGEEEREGRRTLPVA